MPIQNTSIAAFDSSLPNKLRSEFVANMSHELRTPRNAVLGLAKIGEVRLQAQSVDNKAQIQVVDTGNGMSDTQLTRLFKPFEQADTLTTRRFGGTELGLSISKNLVRMMQGDISVKTCFNVGSKFILT